MFLSIAPSNLASCSRHLSKVYYEQALAIADDIGDRQGRAAYSGSLGNACVALGQFKEGIRYYRHALELHREMGERGGQGNDLANLGSVYHTLGEHELAAECLLAAESLFREVESPYITIVQNNLREVEKALGPDRYLELKKKICARADHNSAKHSY